ncbi:MAG: lipoyl(octanoyl) transferase LipB [Bdellovibrionales bacterium]|nr:lipoyl(octanoyl) transferase LipB [Bdellovibrionales bacterium]
MERIRSLGRIPYAEAWEIQRDLLEKRASGEIPDTLLILEHPHVITMGRKTPGVRELEESGRKEWQGVPLFFVERGGEATYHGPGQIVMYPIFELSGSFGPKQFLRLMELAVVDLLRDFFLDAWPIEGKTGVWLKDPLGRERKIASLGIAVRKNVSWHGLALNVSTDLSYFKKISPCGFAPEVMTTLEELTGATVDHAAAATRLAQLLLDRFQAVRK